LLRIVQEALANVRKHAGARQVEVRIGAIPEGIEVVVADDGRGFDPGRDRASGDRMPHFGLATMRERAESVGGTLEVVSAHEEGTRVTVRLPTRT
jgi:signal transduction histidine kinase